MRDGHSEGGGADANCWAVAFCTRQRVWTDGDYTLTVTVKDEAGNI
ncbi:hypothetical protein KCP78_21620 [Salmonella enterica subsp. enterica]|nr:hypothetical protein KCP78_21620 [Salmonella enterica subsp. enterica]